MIKKISITFAVVVTLFIGSLALSPSPAFAAGPASCYQKSGFLGFPTWYEYLELGKNGDDPCAILGPKEPGTKDFSFQKALPRIGLAITEILLRVAGMVAIGYVVFGGFKYMTSQGEPDGIKQAQGTVMNALIGLAIAVLAVTIVSFVGRTLW